MSVVTKQGVQTNPNFYYGDDDNDNEFIKVDGKLDTVFCPHLSSLYSECQGQNVLCFMVLCKVLN